MLLMRIHVLLVMLTLVGTCPTRFCTCSGSAGSTKTCDDSAHTDCHDHSSTDDHEHEGEEPAPATDGDSHPHSIPHSPNCPFAKPVTPPTGVALRDLRQQVSGDELIIIDSRVDLPILEIRTKAIRLPVQPRASRIPLYLVHLALLI